MHRSCCQQNSSTVEFVDPRSTLRGWTHIIYYTSVDRNAVTPLVRFLADLLYNLFLQLCSVVIRIMNKQSASRGPSAVAELLVWCWRWRCTVRFSTDVRWPKMYFWRFSAFANLWRRPLVHFTVVEIPARASFLRYYWVNFAGCDYTYCFTDIGVYGIEAVPDRPLFVYIIFHIC